MSVLQRIRLIKSKLEMTLKTTRAKQREASISAVLTAAAELFSKVGYEGASLNTIAERSGVSKPNIIYYFGSKEALWKETVADLFENVNAEFAMSAYRIGENATFKELVSSYFEVARRYPAYVFIPMIEGINESWRSKLLAEQYLAPHVTRFEKIMRSQVASDRIKDLPPLHIQNLVTGGAQLFLALAPLWANAIAKDTTSEAFLEDYAETISILLTR